MVMWVIIREDNQQCKTIISVENIACRTT